MAKLRGLMLSAAALLACSSSVSPQETPPPTSEVKPSRTRPVSVEPVRSRWNTDPDANHCPATLDGPWQLDHADLNASPRAVGHFPTLEACLERGRELTYGVVSCASDCVDTDEGLRCFLGATWSVGFEVRWMSSEMPTAEQVRRGNAEVWHAVHNLDESGLTLQLQSLGTFPDRCACQTDAGDHEACAQCRPAVSAFGIEPAADQVDCWNLIERTPRGSPP